MSDSRKLVAGDQSFDLRLDFFLCPKHGLFVPSRIDAEWNTDLGCPIVAWPGDDETCGADLTPVFLDGLVDASTEQGGGEQTNSEMLAEFHTRFNYERTSDPALRLTLHQEEHNELVEALEDSDLGPIARELADVVYVAYGSAWSLGLDLDAAIREVHRANLSKLGDDGEPIYREDGKVLKGPNFSPPDMSSALPSEETRP